MKEAVGTYVYRVVDGIDLTADVYLPDRRRRAPAILWLHGGALILGSRKDIAHRRVGRWVFEPARGMSSHATLSAVVSWYGYGDVTAPWYSRPSPFYRRMPLVTREAALEVVGAESTPWCPALAGTKLAVGTAARFIDHHLRRF